MTSIYRTNKGADRSDRGFRSGLRKVALAVAFAVSAGSVAVAADIPVKAVPKKAAPPPFFFVNDTSVSFTWYPRWTDPGVAGSSNIVSGGIAGQHNYFNNYQTSMDHFDVWEYGTNLIHGEFNQYAGTDPTEGTPGATGSREFFGFWTGTLGFNELSHSKAFATPVTKDVSFMLNLTGNTQNNYLSPDLAQVAPGIQLTLNLPGVVDVGITAMKEWNHSEFDACGAGLPGFGDAIGVGGGTGGNGACAGGGGPIGGDRSFEWTWKVFSFISEPLTFLPDSFPLTWINVLNITGPKGTGISKANCNAVGFGGSCTAGNPFVLGAPSAFTSNETKTEIFEDTRLSLDTSKVFWGKPGIWDTYVGYRYWENKFGTNHNAPLFAITAPGTSITSSVYVGSTYHFH
jgi:hypothetical protein